MMQEQAGLSERERELGAIIRAYSDVTERLKDAHEQLNGEVAGLRDELSLKNAELRRRERLAALGEMAAGLAHEVRNPLGGIALYSSMLEGDLADRPKACAAARKISQGVRSLDRLVSEILDFAQQDRLDRRACRLGDILSQVEDCLRPWAAECRADVHIDDSAYEVKVDCDPLRLRQVLLNLMINGLQAAGEGGRVGLSAKPWATNGEGDVEETPLGPPLARGEVQIEVWDDGPGIPAEQLERVFNPFFTTKETGTGLGLAIVHRIVEAHGGSIRAMNRLEGGALFVLRWPSGEKD